MYGYSTINLPARSHHWSESVAPSLPPPLSLNSDLEPFVRRDAIVLRVPWSYTKRPCPVNDKNRDVWTERERMKAEKRVIAKDLKHAQSLVSSLNDMLYCIR